MAKLLSEDAEYKSFLELKAGPVLESTSGQKEEVWQYFILTLGNGHHELTFASANTTTFELEQSAFKDYAKVANGYLLCRKPKDEVKSLITLLHETLGGKAHAVFEPLEPSFELTLVNDGSAGIKATIFVDEGNVETSVYRWDAFGLRFFTTQANLARFTNELKEEFAC